MSYHVYADLMGDGERPAIIEPPTSTDDLGKALRYAADIIDLCPYSAVVLPPAELDPIFRADFVDDNGNNIGHVRITSE